MVARAELLEAASDIVGVIRNKTSGNFLKVSIEHRLSMTSFLERWLKRLVKIPQRIHDNIHGYLSRKLSIDKDGS